MAGLKYWVWLSEVKGLTNRSKLLLLDYFGTPENVYYADEDEYRLVEGIEPRQIALLAEKSLENADRILGACSRLGRLPASRPAHPDDAGRGLSDAPAQYLRAAVPALCQRPAPRYRRGGRCRHGRHAQGLALRHRSGGEDRLRFVQAGRGRDLRRGGGRGQCVPSRRAARGRKDHRRARQRAGHCLSRGE